MYDKSNTNVGMSFPVNLPSSAFRLTTAKNDDNEFVIDAVSTDGGSHPRNVAIQSTMALVQFGAQGVTELTTFLGCYTMLAFNVNAFEVGLPTERTEQTLPV